MQKCGFIVAAFCCCAAAAHHEPGLGFRRRAPRPRPAKAPNGPFADADARPAAGVAGNGRGHSGQALGGFLVWLRLPAASVSSEKPLFALKTFNLDAAFDLIRRSRDLRAWTANCNNAQEVTSLWDSIAAAARSQACCLQYLQTLQVRLQQF